MMVMECVTLGDEDDDNDGVSDIDDMYPLNGSLCLDVDADGCDDCSDGKALT